ncbi:MAG TPA: DUF3239 domain-containing protein [Verrucomicrobiales bacterium]|nr:DUF3239 domain-containing protein [Verrucomicrobiales bacterium]
MDARTIDNSTQASNPGSLTVSRQEYARYYGGNLFGRMAMLGLSYLPVVNFLGWIRFSEHFRHGDTNPAVVINKDTGLVACYTDLDTAMRSRFHVIKLFKAKLHLANRLVQNGTTMAAVSLYYGTGEDRARGRWRGFCPILADCVAMDSQQSQSVKAKIPPSHWKALDMGLRQLGPRRLPGTYDITLPQELKAEISSNEPWFAQPAFAV